MTDGSRKATIATCFANLGIAIAEFVDFLITRTAGMLAESVHSFADTGNQALPFLGGSRARRDPTPEHPFGDGGEPHYRVFTVALVLFSMGGPFARYEGIEESRHLHPPIEAARTSRRVPRRRRRRAGAVVALIGVVVAHQTGDGGWDASGSIAIRLLLILIAVVLTDRDDGSVGADGPR